MTPSIALDIPATHATDSAHVHVVRSTDDLGEAIAELAARLHAATYQLLVMLREFDAHNGWNNGFLSCAHWLHWRTGIDLGACREKVRVAKALAGLPLTSATMECGQLSYAKVRAITRVATQDNERRLVDVALAGTAAQVERVARAWRRVDRAEEAAHTNTCHLHRHLSLWLDDDGMVVIRGRLSPEVGAVVQRALDAAAGALLHENAGAVTAHSLQEEITHGQRRADALARLAEVALTANLDSGSAGDRYQVIVHTDINDKPGSTGDSDAGGVVETDFGPIRVSAETSRRIACEAAVVVMRHDAAGNTLDVGRRTRTIPPSVRRALEARDHHCRFPGCTSRRCDAHHVEHWMDGGRTSLSNLVLLCRRHHRLGHEGQFCVTANDSGGWRVVDAHGAVLADCPPAGSVAPHSELPRAACGRPPVWDGATFNLAYAIDVLR